LYCFKKEFVFGGGSVAFESTDAICNGYFADTQAVEEAQRERQQK
jgi:hypothetical protein